MIEFQLAEALGDIKVLGRILLRDAFKPLNSIYLRLDLDPLHLHVPPNVPNGGWFSWLQHALGEYPCRSLRRRVVAFHFVF
jgi:hypothetical protein